MGAVTDLRTRSMKESAALRRPVSSLLWIRLMTALKLMSAEDVFDGLLSAKAASGQPFVLGVLGRVPDRVSKVAQVPAHGACPIARGKTTDRLSTARIPTPRTPRSAPATPPQRR
jgi:hypothetical protein